MCITISIISYQLTEVFALRNFEFDFSVLIFSVFEFDIFSLFNLVMSEVGKE